MKSASVSVGDNAGRGEAVKPKHFIILIAEQVFCLDLWSWESNPASLTLAATGTARQLQPRAHMVGLFSKRLPTKKAKSKTYCCPSSKYSNFFYAGSQCFPSTLLHLQILSSLQCSQSRGGKKIIVTEGQNVQQINRNRFEETNLTAFCSNFLALIFIYCFLENKLIVLHILSKHTFLGR